MSLADKVTDNIIGIVIVFFIVAGLASTLIAASNNISASGLPLASLFTPTGVVLIVVMIGIFLGVYKMSKHKK